MKCMLFSLLAVALLGVASQSGQAQWVVQPTTVWSPVIMPAPVMQPMVVQSAPVFAPMPMPVTTFYRAPVVTMAPVPQVVTRNRPILGGSVSRVRYGWAPVAF